MIYAHHKIDNLNIVFTDRLDGYSQDNPNADYASLNLGFHVGDDYDTVQRNYSKVLHELDIYGRPIAIARQVHGTDMAEISRLAGDISAFDWERACEADMMRASSPDDGVSIMLFADCLPVILYDFATHTAMTVHAGWKGLGADIVGKAISTYPPDANLSAVIGPGIDSCCYEVNEDISRSVTNLFPQGSDMSGIIVNKDGRYYLSIKSAVAKQLRDRGISDITMYSPCTSCDSRFYSHRRSSHDKKVSGRQASIVYYEV